MSLFFLLSACMPKKEIPLASVLITKPDIATYMDLQARCDVLLFSFENKKLLFSQEFFVEKENLLSELEWYFPWAMYPKSLKTCIDQLNNY